MRPLGNLLVTMAGVGAGFVVFLWAGFHWHGQSAPMEIETLFAPAALVFGIAVAVRLFSLAMGLHERIKLGAAGVRARQEARNSHTDWQRRRSAQIARLSADPVRSGYAERIERGENWTDAQIEYDLDPDTVGTCVHLAPYEHALRRAGMPVKLQYGNIVSARCTIDEAELRRQFTIEPPAWYGTFEQYDRSQYDPPGAAFKCPEHGAMLYVIEPSQAGPDTPRFPV